MLLLRLLAAFAAFSQVSAQTQSNAVQLFIHNMDPEAQWAASIQNACSGSTTYVVSCTSAPMNNACSPQTATITEASNVYIATTPAIYSETSATFTETCSLDTAASSASCTATIVAGQYGNDISKTISFNLTGTDYYQYDVAITKGASHTKDGGSCLAPASGTGAVRFGQGMQGVAAVGAMMITGVAAVLAL